MSSRLDRIKDWNPVFEKAHYRADELPQAAGASARSLRREFEKRFGKPPQAEMDHRRGELARKMLLASEDEKTIIARTGFRTIAHFSSWFKKRFGLTPSLYRTVGLKISIGKKDVTINGHANKRSQNANRHS